MKHCVYKTSEWQHFVRMKLTVGNRKKKQTNKLTKLENKP